MFDANEGRKVFVDPPDRSRETQESDERSVWGEAYRRVLSRDGTRVLGIGTGKLWEVDTGRVLWECRKGPSAGLIEFASDPRSVDPQGRFEVHERWSFFNIQSAKGIAYAVRSLNTGQLVYRCWHSTVHPDAVVSSDGRLIFDRIDDVVRSLPPVVNYPLFALCQTILALPLVLTWALLCWRRRRAERRSRECGGRA